MKKQGDNNLDKKPVALIAQGSFQQCQVEVVELLLRKHRAGKLSEMGKEFLKAVKKKI